MVAMSESTASHPRRLRLLTVVVLAVAVASAVWLVVRNPTEPTGTLADAVAGGDVALARRLLAGGADPDSPRVLGLTPLMRAVNRDDVEMAAVLIEAGASLGATDPEGLSPIHIAAQADAAESIVLLIRNGADVAALSRSGMAPIHSAADTGSALALEALVRHGVDPDLRSEAVTQGHGYPRVLGATPLGLAARRSQEAAVATLLATGATVDAPSTSGHTPLQIAVFAGSRPELVQALLEAGADPTVVAICELGCSVASGDVLAWARELDRTELVPLLEAALAE